MAWAAPRTWTVNEVLTAANMNTYISGDLLQTSPALAQANGDLFPASGANVLSRVAGGAKGAILTAVPSVAGGGIAWQAIGSNGQIPLADSSQTNGWKWGALAANAISIPGYAPGLTAGGTHAIASGTFTNPVGTLLVWVTMAGIVSGGGTGIQLVVGSDTDSRAPVSNAWNGCMLALFGNYAATVAWEIDIVFTGNQTPVTNESTLCWLCIGR